MTEVEIDTPELATAIVRARVASRVADVMAARARVVAAVGGALDEEAVHDYRVGLRRLRCAMRALRPVWGKTTLAPIELELKALADATGDVRDEEVLVETLEAIDLEPEDADALATWQKGRARRLAGARAAAGRKLAGPSLGGALAATLHRVETTLATPPRRPLRQTALQYRSIGKMAGDVVLRAGAARAEDVEAMHTLRIRVKRLRYAIELLFAPSNATDKALKAAQKLQKRLGELHDVDEAKVRMARAWGLPEATRAAIRRQLVRLRDSVARKAVRELGSLVPALEREVANLLNPPASG